jgi:hypothetical protein
MEDVIDSDDLPDMDNQENSQPLSKSPSGRRLSPLSIETPADSPSLESPTDDHLDGLAALRAANGYQSMDMEEGRQAKRSRTS